jgi:hypothetical protein
MTAMNLSVLYHEWTMHEWTMQMCFCEGQCQLRSQVASSRYSRNPQITLQRLQASTEWDCTRTY